MSHPFGELLREYRRRKPGLTQERLAHQIGYDAAVLVRMAQGKKDLTGPSGRDRIIKLIEALHENGVLHTLADANALLASADQPPLYAGLPVERALIQVLQPEMDTRLRAVRHTLPAQVSSFIGREHDIQQVAELLLKSRLVTLTGAGGNGKTRLALKVGQMWADAFTHGASFIGLAPVRHADDVLLAIAQALGLRESPGTTLLDAVRRYISGKSILLVLDNFEHVLDSAGLVSELLAAAPKIKVIITSREPLRLNGEHIYEVEPLEMQSAVELFAQRARAVKTSFELTDDITPVVMKICQRVDRLPLAIELAAARMRHFTPKKLLESLNPLGDQDRLDVLTYAPRDAPRRHRTLRATFLWSYELLDDGEQFLLRRLSVFAGGWQIEQAESVAASDESAPRSTRATLMQLVNKSVVVSEERAEQNGYRMLETIRGFALEQLEQHDEAADARRAHAEAYCKFAEENEHFLNRKARKQWLLRLEQEHNNFRAALGWALATNDATGLGLRLAAALWYFWEARGYLREGQAWLNKSLDANPDRLTEAHAKALLGAGSLASDAQEIDQAIALTEESLALYQTLGNRRGTARALCQLARIESEREEGDAAKAQALSERSLVLFRELDDLAGIEIALSSLGGALHHQQKFEQAALVIQESLSMCQQLEDPVAEAYALNGLGWLKYEQDAYAEAIALADAGLALLHEQGEIAGMNYLLYLRTDAALKLKNYDLAMSGARQQIASNQEIENTFGVAIALAQVGWIEFEQRHDIQARAAFAQSLSLKHPEAWPVSNKMALLIAFRDRFLADGKMWPTARLSGFLLAHTDALNDEHLASTESAMNSLRKQFPAIELNAALAEGRAMSLEQALDCALTTLATLGAFSATIPSDSTA